MRRIAVFVSISAVAFTLAACSSTASTAGEGTQTVESDSGANAGGEMGTGTVAGAKAKVEAYLNEVPSEQLVLALPQALPAGEWTLAGLSRLEKKFDNGNGMTTGHQVTWADAANADQTVMACVQSVESVQDPCAIASADPAMLSSGAGYDVIWTFSGSFAGDKNAWLGTTWVKDAAGVSWLG